MEHLSVGTSAPDFELKTADGTPIRLSTALEDGSVVLAFYKSSCPTCRFTFPFVQQLFDGFGPDKRPTVLGISQDEADETVQFADEAGVRFPILIDEHPYTVSSAYELHFVPTLFLVDTDQLVRAADYGFSKSALSEIANYLARELAESPPTIFADGDGLPETRPG